MSTTVLSEKDCKDLNRLEVKRVVRRLETLPALPVVAAKIIEIFSGEDPDANEVIKLIETDQAIAMKILKLVNSAYFGLPSRISTIQKAVVMLGSTELRCALLGAAVSDALIKSLGDAGGRGQDDLWKHSLGCAVCAEKLAGKACPDLQAEAFVGGLLHDVGKLILEDCFPDVSGQIRAEHTEKGIPWLQAEKSILGVDHPTVGKWLAEKWKLPRIFIQAIWMHHHPLSSIQELGFIGQKKIIITIHLADILAHEIMADSFLCHRAAIEHKDILEFLDVTPDDLENLSISMGRYYSERASILDLEEDEPSFYYGALKRANKKLVKIASKNVRYRALKKINQELGLLHDLHLELARIEDAEEVLDRAAQTIELKLKKPKGVIYRINQEERILKGRYWLSGAESSAFSFELDENGQPATQKIHEIDDGLGRLIESSPKRFPEISVRNRQINLVQYSDPYFVMPLIIGDRIVGEIGIGEEDGTGNESMAEGNLKIYGYLASIIETALSRIELIEEARETAESLSATLSKNNQMMLLLKKSISEKQEMEQEILRAQKLESIGVVVGGIAHDFNNILTAISGNVSLAKMYVKPGEKAFEKLIQAEKAFLRAKDLNRQLLTFSKRGGAPVKKVVSITDLIKESVGFALRGSNVRCQYSLPDGLLLVEVDEGQINQVLNNLIINADQAMPEGGTISISGENISLEKGNELPFEEGKYVKITIKDQGIGIPKEDLTRIFDPYFTTKKKGSGLGLATAYSIVKKHGGYISVNSEPGMGTTFFLYLPASENGRLEKKDKEEKPLTGMGKVLVMDDEKDIRELAGEMLESIGYEVGFAKDGMEAIEIYKRALKTERPFDAVIIDLTIPGGMGGKEAIQKLHEIVPEVKAIVSSGYVSHPVMVDFKKYGFCDVIAKPYKISELSKVLHKTISKYSSV